jgi:hypothetical protein
MIQTGDPTGSGKGGQSIWGVPFEDEARTSLKARMLIYSTKRLIKVGPVQREGHGGHGKLRTRHEQIAVLYRL